MEKMVPRPGIRKGIGEKQTSINARGKMCVRAVERRSSRMPRKNATSERLDEFEERLSRIEEGLRLLRGRVAGKGQLTETGERTVEPWEHLVRRPHPWRKQLYLRGRNMTARQLVGGIRANELDEEQAAA